MTMDSHNSEVPAVGADRKFPPWVDPHTPERPWIDVRAVEPTFHDRPYLVEPGDVARLRHRLVSAGFEVVSVHVSENAEDVERAFLVEMTRSLELDELGAGSWAAFNDRLGDFVTGEESAPYAVLIYGLDALARLSTYHFLRCVHNLLSLTEGIGLSDIAANRQIEYFFVGDWIGPAS